VQSQVADAICRKVSEPRFGVLGQHLAALERSNLRNVDKLNAPTMACGGVVEPEGNLVSLKVGVGVCRQSRLLSSFTVHILYDRIRSIYQYSPEVTIRVWTRVLPVFTNRVVRQSWHRSKPLDAQFRAFEVLSSKDRIPRFCVLKMNSSFYVKLSSSFLVIHGSIEILALSMLVLPPEFIPISLSGDFAFWALIGGMHGICRIVSGYAIVKRRENGIIFGILLSTVTVAGAPNIQPFGLMDLPLSAIVLWALLTLLFGSQKIEDQ